VFSSIAIVGGIMCVLSSSYCPSVELCAFLEVYVDSRWNCVRV
jgi:hypothetical protein